MSIEERKLRIEKLKEELSEKNISDTSIQYASKIANENLKVVSRRSNFYKTLVYNHEVTEVGFTTLDNDQKPVNKEVIVPRTAFINFIQHTDKLPVEIDDNARIEIVAPVLIEGKAKWKGFYKEEYISFSMDDDIYREAVLKKRISFKNGDIIICLLEIHKKLNEVGEIIVTKHSVRTVLETIENGVSSETPSGKIYKQEKRIKDSQTDLFTD